VLSEPRGQSGTAGGVLGVLVFLAGVAILVFTFGLARDLFTQDPNQVLGLSKDKPLDLNNAGATLVGVLLKVLLLLVMALVGGMIANRGIKLYADSRIVKDSAPKREA
jgi:hypothetical protein